MCARMMNRLVPESVHTQLSTSRERECAGEDIRHVTRVFWSTNLDVIRGSCHGGCPALERI